MIKNIIKVGIPSVLVLSFLFGGFGFALAQEGALPDAIDRCRVRTAVSNEELKDLLGETSQTVTAMPNGVQSGGQLMLNVDGAGIVCTYALIKSITNWVFIAVLALSTLMLAYASFLFVTGGANSKKITQARQVILYAVGGLLIALVARVVPSIVRSIIGI